MTRLITQQGSAFLLAGFIFVAGAACGAPRPTFESLQSLIEEQRYTAAITQAEAYLQAHPDNWHARFLRAVALVGQSRDQAALKALKALAQDYPPDDQTSAPAARDLDERTKPKPHVKAANAAQLLPGPNVLARRKQRIIQTVNAWAKAWSQQNFTTYISAYAADFPPGRSHEIWRSLRKERVMQKAWIQLQVISPNVQLLGGGRAHVSFIQTYQSPTYSDRVKKTLTLQQTNTGWRIVREASSPLERK